MKMKKPRRTDESIETAIQQVLAEHERAKQRLEESAERLKQRMRDSDPPAEADPETRR